MVDKECAVIHASIFTAHGCVVLSYFKYMYLINSEEILKNMNNQTFTVFLVTMAHGFTMFPMKSGHLLPQLVEAHKSTNISWMMMRKVIWVIFMQ